MTSVNSIIKGIDKPVSVGGDPIERSGGGGGGGSITVAPNIYITGSQDFQGDLRRMAREVGSLLEKEVRLTMMRSS
jgi:hypothetical protein